MTSQGVQATHHVLRRIIGLSIYRLLQRHGLRSSTDPLFDRVSLVASTQTEQAYSLVTAVIPALKPFLNELDTGFGIDFSAARQADLLVPPRADRSPRRRADSGCGSEVGIYVKYQYEVATEGARDECPPSTIGE